MLQNGAVKVYAVDVGYGQLAWSLRTDERVVNMERTNIRNVKPENLAEQIEFFSVDVSFISLHHIFPVAQAITTPDAMGVCLVKPQFELDAKRLARTVWCATLLPTVKCCTMPWAMLLQTVLLYADWISAR